MVTENGQELVTWFEESLHSLQEDIKESILDLHIIVVDHLIDGEDEGKCKYYILQNLSFLLILGNTFNSFNAKAF